MAPNVKRERSNSSSDSDSSSSSTAKRKKQDKKVTFSKRDFERAQSSMDADVGMGK